jgi:lipopolysaccharide export system permease protein
MNNIIFKYLLNNFVKTFLMVALVIYSFGVILNLFEEVEFFKNHDVSIFIPLMLTGIFVPSIVLKLLPFIIFISSMLFMVKIRNNKELLNLKVYGYSNLRIFFLLAVTSFVMGWLILFFVSPITSSMVKYYEKTKSQYARDIDHLVTFNKNGLWIKEKLEIGERIITAKKPEDSKLIEVTIFSINENYNLDKKIFARKANIETNNWVLEDATVFTLGDDGIFIKEVVKEYKLISIYNYEKIVSLFNNSDTMSFLNLLIDYKSLIDGGYNKIFLSQSLHVMLVMPFYLFLMTALAAILTMHTLQRSDNFRFILLGLICSVLIYYFKDLSIALGQTDRIPLTLGIWSPIIALSLFTFVGVLQINEK